MASEAHDHSTRIFSVISLFAFKGGVCVCVCVGGGGGGGGALAKVHHLRRENALF